MLITDLSVDKQKALAKEIKSLIEPEKAQTVRLIKETELRQFLSKKGLTANMRDVIQLLQTYYAQEPTVKRLLSKIQQSVVWDTSLVGLTIQKLGELFYCNPRTNIFLTSVLDELKKKMNEPDIKNSNKFRYLYLSIINDSNSEFSTIVNYESEEKYTDTQILNYAYENKYRIYTYDYTMGLRAKSRQIPVSIFNRITEEKVPNYYPVSGGKNIILTPELLENLSVEEIIKTAHILHASKFVLTSEFIEKLETLKQRLSIREYINFLVFDDEEKYTTYAEGSDYETLCKKHNAFVLINSDTTAITLKQNQIPYHIILKSDDLEFMKKMNTQITLPRSTEQASNYSLITNTPSSEVPNLVSAAEHETTPALISSTDTCKIPNYHPYYDSITYPKSALEKIWVLDETLNEVKVSEDEKHNHKYFKAFPGYFVIHGINNLDGTYSITVYKIIVKGSYKTGQIMQKFTFEKDSTLKKASDVPKDYRHYASVLILST